MAKAIRGSNSIEGYVVTEDDAVGLASCHLPWLVKFAVQRLVAWNAKECTGVYSS